MMFSDACFFVVAHAVAYVLRFEFSLSQFEFHQMLKTLLWFLPLKMVIFFVFGLYRGMWRYVSVRDFWHLAQASIMSTLLRMAVILYLYRFQDYSRAVFLVDGLLTFLFTGGTRIMIRSYYATVPLLKFGSLSHPSREEMKGVLVIGAGDAGEKILREIFDNERLHYDVVGFIDDDPAKQGRSIHGVPVLGPVKHLPDILSREKVDEVLIAVPSATGPQMRRIIDMCKGCKVVYKTLPGIGEIIDGRVSLKVLRDVSYEDLLGRPSVHLDIAKINNYLHDRTVLITGCGGSIGSELCRHVIRFNPRALILVDASEANLFQIQMELLHEMRYHNHQTILGLVQDSLLMKDVFQRYKPQVVFHAAAYKHVPMLEKNPWEAVFNNIMGSRIAMEAAVDYGVERFVLVSTDKAVKPTNVMGASKRISELLLQSFRGNGTRFMAVRFGNVVGSSGSVVPLFRRQIEQGGPVTVTDPDVTRYFMTIPEAAQLIIQAGSMGEGGEIFILEMGTPVRIADMARDLIKLSGKEPDRDIQIIFTGLRDGEKLHEELITAGENVVETAHEKILMLRSSAPHNGWAGPEDLRAWLTRELEELNTASLQHDTKAIKKKLKDIVPEYSPQETKSVL
jgi:FlaA1/EpsC-like NDP-sugar epimerase